MQEDHSKLSVLPKKCINYAKQKLIAISIMIFTLIIHIKHILLYFLTINVRRENQNDVL